MTFMRGSYGGAIAFDVHRDSEIRRGRLDGRKQLEIIASRETGGMNTHSRPSRGSTPSAVRTANRRCRTVTSWRCRAVAAAPHRSPLAQFVVGRQLQGAQADLLEQDAGWAARHAARTGRPARTAAAPRRQLRQRLQRQAKSERRIAGNEEQMLAAQSPEFAVPARPRCRRIRGLHRQHEPGRLRQRTVKAPMTARARPDRRFWGRSGRCWPAGRFPGSRAAAGPHRPGRHNRARCQGTPRRLR